MTSTLQTFATNGLPAGFGKEGPVRFPKSFDWGFTAKDSTNVESGISVLPQTSDRFCLIDDPTRSAAGVRKHAGENMSQFFIDHNDGTVTYGNRGARLFWNNVTIPVGGILQFHYIFLRGQWNRPFNGFAQFLAVESDGTVVLKRTFAQTAEPGPSEAGKFYRWRAHRRIIFERAFSGTLQWVVSNGQRRNKDDMMVHRDTDLHPSGLALDFISIIT